jgi:hypothetical protein
MKKQKRKRHKDAGVASGLRITTTVDFGEKGGPLTLARQAEGWRRKPYERRVL